MSPIRSPEEDEPPEPALGGEAARLRVLAAELGDPDLSDDCAHLTDHTALVTTDALVEGVHFDLARDTLEQVGAQAAVANLSDLAASGGAAGWLVWALMLPDGFDEPMLRALARGFGRTAAENGARVVGGNLSRTRGPLVVSVTAWGPLAGDHPFVRTGAKPGDGVYLSGPVGDAALGVADPDPEARAARHAWRPHLREAAILAEWGGVTAALDVSDGLLLDASRLPVAIHIDSAAVPTGPLYQRRHPDPGLALVGGEDYVLLFTAGRTPPIGTRIGSCVPGRGVCVDGEPVRGGGWDHF